MIRKNNVNSKTLLYLIENNVNKSYFKFKTHYIHFSIILNIFLNYILVFNLIIIRKFKNLTIYLWIAIN